jgi:hypothetical protein
VQQIEYIEGQNGEFVPIDNNYSPVKITNMHTTIDVEKKWLNKAGTGPDTASHANDSVWVQLYKQTRENSTAPWAPEDGEAVGDPIELKQSNSWKHTYEVSQTGEDVRYFVKEGVMEGGSFVAKTALSAAKTSATDTGKPYAWVSTVYTAKTPSFSMPQNTSTAAPVITWAESTTTANPDSPNQYVSVPEKGKASAVISNKPSTIVKLLKVDADDHTASLEGAKFKVYKDDGTAGYNANTDNVPAFTNNPDSETEGNDGSVLISGLDAGTYWLVETEAPTGYLVRSAEHPIGIVVSNDGAVTLVADSYDTDKTRPTISAQPNADGAYELTAPNTRTWMLPTAGGLGILELLFIGAFVMTLAVGLRRRAFSGA